MNKLIIPILAGVLCAASSSHAAPTPAQEEAHWLADFRKTGDLEPLVNLARVREERGKWKEASDTWGLIARNGRFSRGYAWDGTSGEGSPTWVDLADWWKTRIARQSRGVAKVSVATIRASDQAYVKLFKNPRATNIARVDMDGDGLAEVVYHLYASKDAKLPSSFVVEKWDKNHYARAFVIADSSKEFPYHFRVSPDASGWGRVLTDASGAQDDNIPEKVLLSNGEFIHQVPEVGYAG